MSRRREGIKLCRDCGVPVTSNRHTYCQKCAHARHYESANRSQKSALKDQRELKAKPVVDRKKSKPLMSDKLQSEINIAVDSRWKDTPLTDPRGLHMTWPAAWLWRSA